MSNDLANVCPSVVTFCRLAVSVHRSVDFANCLCGPRSVLAAAMSDLLEQQASEESCQHFQTGLQVLDGKITANRFIGDAYKKEHDATLAERWAALHALVRAELWERDDAGCGKRLRAAKDSFDRLWKDHTLGAALPPSVSLSDSRTAETADESLFNRVERHLHPWTPGSWMVWDVLSQWNPQGDPVAMEATPVLFAGGDQGQMMRLVVEALPGPPGLATPNWWRLGLCAFKTADRNRFLPAAVQHVIHRAAANAPGLRLRWHLDADEPDPWKIGLDGRSIEAAAAVAALAVLERYSEQQEWQGDTSSAAPILDAQAVVTGVVGNTRESNPALWPIGDVNPKTLLPKIEAAVSQRLDRIAVPATQCKDLVAPNHVHLEGVSTVGEAFELLRAVHRAFDHYRAYVRSLFKYHEEETPAAK